MDYETVGAGSAPQEPSNGDENLDIESPDEEIEYVLDDKPQRVVQGLWIGSLWAEMNESALNQAGITDILQVAQGLFPRHPLRFTYMILQVEDSPSTDLVRYFPKCFEFIDTAISKGGSVLVHCAAGVSRSATVVLGYLMSRHHFSLAAALHHLKAVRPWVAPNQGFLQQLEAFEAAKCDLTHWRPWNLVWHEQQQQQQQQQQQHQSQEDRVAAMELLSLPPSQQQQQDWLQVPQPGASSTTSTPQQQQQQQRRHDGGCSSCSHSAPAAAGGGGCCGGNGGGCGSNGGSSAAAPSGTSSLSHHHYGSLAAATAATATAAAAASAGPGCSRGSVGGSCSSPRNGYVSSATHHTAAVAGKAAVNPAPAAPATSHPS